MPAEISPSDSAEAPDMSLEEAPSPSPMDGNVTDEASLGGPVKFQLGSKPVGRRLLYI